MGFQAHGVPLPHAFYSSSAIVSSARWLSVHEVVVRHEDTSQMNLKA